MVLALQAKMELSSKTGWEDYGGHHLENLATAYFHEVWLPRRFGLDFRNLKVSADVRNKKISRATGEAVLNSHRRSTAVLEEYVRNRLQLSIEEYERLMEQPLKYSNDFKTYKPIFKKLKYLFFLLAKRDLVPMSFYLKYCK